jgi:hypothetical protein
MFGRNQGTTGGPAVIASTPVRQGSTSVTETIDAFHDAAASVPAIIDVVARSQGEHVDFVVTATGVWHEAIDALEPKLSDLIVVRGADLDYRVRRPGDEDPVGYLPVFHRD